MKFITTFLQHNPFSVFQGELQFAEQMLNRKKGIPNQPSADEIGEEEDLSLWHEEIEIVELDNEDERDTRHVLQKRQEQEEDSNNLSASWIRLMKTIWVSLSYLVHARKGIQGGSMSVRQIATNVRGKHPTYDTYYTRSKWTPTKRWCESLKQEFPEGAKPTAEKPIRGGRSLVHTF